MDSRRVPALLALVGVVLAVGLFLLLKDDTADDDAERPATTAAAAETEPETPSGDNKPERNPKPEVPEVPVVEIQGGEPVGGVHELEFKSGEEATFEVEADAADELHFHGYDLYVDVGPGKPAEVRFDADIEGLFELESHSTGALMAEITVIP